MVGDLPLGIEPIISLNILNTKNGEYKLVESTQTNHYDIAYLLEGKIGFILTT